MLEDLALVFRAATAVIAEIAVLLDDAVTEGMKVRRLGVRVSDFQDSSGQETLFGFMQR